MEKIIQPTSFMFLLPLFMFLLKKNIKKKFYYLYELAILYTVPLDSVWPMQAKRLDTHGKRTCKNWKLLKCESSTVLQQNSHEKRDSLATNYAVLLSRPSTHRLLGHCLSREASVCRGGADKLPAAPS